MPAAAPRCSTSTPRFINAVGFAVIGGTLVNVTGTRVTFSKDQRGPSAWVAPTCATSSGVAFLNTREQITNQSVVLTINRQF